MSYLQHFLINPYPNPLGDRIGDKPQSMEFHCLALAPDTTATNLGSGSPFCCLSQTGPKPYLGALLERFRGQSCGGSHFLDLLASQEQGQNQI